jgi:GTPase SAR1 family protein
MTDLEIIGQIEKELNVKLEKLDEIKWNNKGYTLNQNGQVTGLGLYRFEIANLNRIISPLKELTSLTQLDLHNNQLSDISPLKELTDLTELSLSQNQLSDISPLKKLTSLTLLYLSSNQLSDISPLKKLTSLTKLYLYNNQLSDISLLKELTSLTQLNLAYNQLSDISPLKELTSLTILDLSDNQLSDISPLRDLKKLNGLNLICNPIENLPPWITDFNIKIQWAENSTDGYITFYDNPLKTPPPEIVKQGKEAIKNYFDQLKDQQEDYLFEAKMLIVGEPGAGKTSLACKMENPDCSLPKEEDTTKGIDVKQYYFPLQKEDFSAFVHPEKLQNRNFRLNLWDFGGQEIYKATHRFFLSKRSLYALVADSRNEDTDFNYWLNIVEMFGGDSPLLIILNEKHQRKRHIDISAMRNRFTNISEILDVDFAEADKTRLNKLERAIKYYVSQLPHIGSPVPAKWTVVREAIESDKRNTITLQDYLAICRENGITKPQDALVLSQYSHDIGVFLHFQDDDLLNKTIFLNPTWATHAVYKILDHALLNQKNGRFNKADAKLIWSEAEYEFVRDELLRLMQKFFLTYEIDNSGEYIVPERLPAVQPEYSWDEKDNLLLRYEYDFFMPKGIVSQFTVQMHRYIGNHNFVWRKGVVLERENTTAEIIETYDVRTIKIRISGKHRRDFMTIITEMLDKINAQYEKMKVEKLIPCNCKKCKVDNNPHFYKYKDLQRRLENGVQEIQCEKSYEFVNVRRLIDEVLNEKSISSDAREEAFKQIACQQEKIERNKVFVSYSHKDREWLDRVQTHLKVLKNLDIEVNIWDDTQIKAGEKWREEIRKALEAAKVAILLVSTDFLASDFICKDELPPLLKAAENDGATILPLILKPCLFSKHPKLAELQAVNTPTTPLSKLTEDEQEEKLVELAERVAELINKN